MDGWPIEIANPVGIRAGSELQRLQRGRGGQARRSLQILESRAEAALSLAPALFREHPVGSSRPLQTVLSASPFQKVLSNNGFLPFLPHTFPPNEQSPPSHWEESPFLITGNRRSAS